MEEINEYWKKENITNLEKHPIVKIAYRTDTKDEIAIGYLLKYDDFFYLSPVVYSFCSEAEAPKKILKIRPAVIMNITTLMKVPSDKESYYLYPSPDY